MLEVGGEHITLAEAARRANMQVATLRRRIVVAGMSPEAAMQRGSRIHLKPNPAVATPQDSD